MNYETEVKYVEHRDDQKRENNPRPGYVSLMKSSLLDPAAHMERIGEADEYIDGVQV